MGWQIDTLKKLEKDRASANRGAEVSMCREVEGMKRGGEEVVRSGRKRRRMRPADWRTGFPGRKQTECGQSGMRATGCLGGGAEWARAEWKKGRDKKEEIKRKR